MGMEEPNSRQIAILSHHLQDNLRIFGITYTHGIVDTSFDGLQQQIGTFAG